MIALGYDSVAPDAKVITSNINKAVFLDVSSKSIADLTGIQDFVSLRTLRCVDNQLTSLNVNSLTNLTYFSYHTNQLKSLDLSKLTLLI